MMVGVPAAALEDLRSLVARRLGLHLDDSRADHVADALRGRMGAVGASDAAAYVASLHEDAKELLALAERLTVSETYFLRNRAHFRALEHEVLPQRIAARAGDRRLRLLSAGCASGEEAYSLATLLLDSFPSLAGWDVSVLGLDVSHAAIRKAREGRYGTWSLRDTPADWRGRHFHADGGRHRVADRVRSLVRFEQRNLADPRSLVTEAGYDVVLCRNVTMYMTVEATRGLIERLTMVMTPGAYLFLGHAETLRGVSQAFRLCHTHDTFYYALKGGYELPAEPAPVVEVPQAEPTWVDAIQRASRRIASLAGSVESRPAEPLPAVSPREAAVELLRAERFVEALAALGGADDPDTALLRAVLLTSCGRLDEAMQVCGEILRRDELDAGAHYVMALCKEHTGDHVGALEHDETAIYLDPSFAMPRLHLGRVARRSGDERRARESLEKALPLLEREDPSRVLLFGGGFSRKALEAVCRAELRACGGAAREPDGGGP